jgi:hypothetical protein
MGFIGKLTEDTANGLWNFTWKYNEGSNTYTFVVPKHYLNGMKFSITKNEKGKFLDFYNLILPNGFGLSYSKDVMLQLEKAVLASIEETVRISLGYYMGTIPEPEKKKDDSTGVAPESSKDEQ